MIQEELIRIEILCERYEVEMTFFDELNRLNLIEIKEKARVYYIPQEHIGRFEKILRLQRELNVNFEGIDVILNLLEKEQNLQQEIAQLKNRLRFYEDSAAGNQ